MPHAVDLLVDRGFLLDIGVGARNVGLRLVVIVIADEIFDRVVGKEAPELAVELRRQRLVGRKDQRRALRLLDHLRHGEGLAGAGDAEQHLHAVVALHALDQLFDRERLVALGLEVGLDDEPLAAFGFLRARRAVRRPDVPGLVGEFLASVAQQPVQRLRGGGDARRRRNLVLILVVARHAVAKRGGELAVDRDRLIRRLVRRFGHVVRLRRFVETLGRLAGSVRGREIGAAVERIIGWRLEAAGLWPCFRLRFQPGLRADPGGALADRGIEQIGQRGFHRRRIRPRRLGARRLGGVLFRMPGRIARRVFRGFRHPAQYGAPQRGEGRAGR